MILFKPRSSPSSTQSPPTAPTLTSEKSPARAGSLLILSAPATLASLHAGPLHWLFSLSFLHGSLLHFLQDFTQRSPWLPNIPESPTSTLHIPLSCLLFFSLAVTIMQPIITYLVCGLCPHQNVSATKAEIFWCVLSTL